ncbi:MAG: asparagine synthetase B, partial [Brochothrix sp.]|nr:asparagine synthetase B [Brochothrix sp.]
MCGFIGCINNKPVAISADDKAVFEKMNKFIEHRGPDDEGYFYEDHISMGFRRLSIVDVENGHQPLAYDDGRYWIIFNGEVYNHVALREELIAKGHTFKTESDTEVIIAMYSEYKEESVKRLRGMFGFVIWDREEKTAFIARDQIGIKPVNYV